MASERLHPVTARQVDAPLLTFNLRTETQPLTLRPGHLLTRQAGIPHAVEAVDGAAFLLTVATATPQPGEP
jgi:hypothetical protein